MIFAFKTAQAKALTVLYVQESGLECLICAMSDWARYPEALEVGEEDDVDGVVGPAVDVIRRENPDPVRKISRTCQKSTARQKSTTRPQLWGSLI